MKKSLIAAALVITTNSGYAHDDANCREISNLLGRLSCYDASHNGPSTEPSNTNVRGITGELNNRTNPMPELGSRTQSRSADSDFGNTKSMFGSRDTRVISGLLTKVDKNPKRATRLYLDNDQIWQPTKNRTLSAALGDRVQIKPGTVGGYLMSIDEGSWFRVKRIDQGG